MKIPKLAVSLMNEIYLREMHPNQKVYCPVCKTKTASVDGECYFSREH